MGFEEISLYRFTCDGDSCAIKSDGPAKSPAMPGMDPPEAAAQLSALGWFIPVNPYGGAMDLYSMLCPECAADEASRADAEFNQQAGLGSTEDRSDEQYDPDERRIWNKLNPAERRALHPSRLGRMATVEDAMALLNKRGMEESDDDSG